jgi:hypothetical protein
VNLALRLGLMQRTQSLDTVFGLWGRVSERGDGGGSIALVISGGVDDSFKLYR